MTIKSTKRLYINGAGEVLDDPTGHENVFLLVGQGCETDDPRAIAFLERFGLLVEPEAAAPVPLEAADVYRGTIASLRAELDSHGREIADRDAEIRRLRGEMENMAKEHEIETRRRDDELAEIRAFAEEKAKRSADEDKAVAAPPADKRVRKSPETK